MGIVMALAVDKATGLVRLKRETIQARTRMSLSQVKRALSGLVGKRVIEGKRTGRSTIYQFPVPGQKDGRVDGSLVDHQMVHGRAIGQGKTPRSIVPGYTGEQWEALREMMRDVGNERRMKGQKVKG